MTDAGASPDATGAAAADATAVTKVGVVRPLDPAALSCLADDGDVAADAADVDDDITSARAPQVRSMMRMPPRAGQPQGCNQVHPTAAPARTRRPPASSSSVLSGLRESGLRVPRAAPGAARY